MSTHFPCSGSYYAHKAGETGPMCRRCDSPVTKPERGQNALPFCEYCYALRDAASAIRNARRPIPHAALVDILDGCFSKFKP